MIQLKVKHFLSVFERKNVVYLTKIHLKAKELINGQSMIYHTLYAKSFPTVNVVLKF